jgi:hypothetical protein
MVLSVIFLSGLVFQIKKIYIMSPSIAGKNVQYVQEGKSIKRE